MRSMLGRELVWLRRDILFFQQTPVSVYFLLMGVKWGWPGLVGEQIESRGHYSIRIMFCVCGC